MKSLKWAVAVLATGFVVGANAADDVIDRTVQVAYQCTANGIKGKVPFHVMYGIKNNQLIVAQGKLREGVLTTGLWAQNAGQNNIFASTGADGTIWTTAKSDGGNVDRVDGGVLSVKQNGVNAVVLADCKLDKKATNKLNDKTIY